MRSSLFVCLAAVLLLATSCNNSKFAKSTATPPPAPSPGPSPTPNPSGQGTRDVDSTQVVSTPSKKLDILLIVDDSNSMLAENQKLAERMADFVNTLQNSNIDWQMCTTVTRALTVNGSPVWGASVYWSSYTPASGVPGWVLKPTPNLSTVFTNTIQNIGAGWAGTDDERGIKAAYWHLYNGDLNFANHSKCYRADAALAMILISDEDVRSVGGDQSAAYYANEYKALESDDQPATLTQQVRDVFGMNKRFTFNSIIVKPGDSTCMTAQDSSGAKSHYGVKYNELSNMTGGGVGSICDSNYSTNLNLFADMIQDSISSLVLECAPVGGVQVTVTPAVTGLSTQVQGSNLVFTPNVPVGRTVNLKYKCPL